MSSAWLDLLECFCIDCNCHGFYVDRLLQLDLKKRNWQIYKICEILQIYKICHDMIWCDAMKYDKTWTCHQRWSGVRGVKLQVEFSSPSTANPDHRHQFDLGDHIDQTILIVVSLILVIISIIISLILMIILITKSWSSSVWKVLKRWSYHEKIKWNMINYGKIRRYAEIEIQMSI